MPRKTSYFCPDCGRRGVYKIYGDTGSGSHADELASRRLGAVADAAGMTAETRSLFQQLDAWVCNYSSRVVITSDGLAERCAWFALSDFEDSVFQRERARLAIANPDADIWITDEPLEICGELWMTLLFEDNSSANSRVGMGAGIGTGAGGNDYLLTRLANRVGVRPVVKTPKLEKADADVSTNTSVDTDRTGTHE